MSQFHRDQSQNSFFFPTNSLKPKDSVFIIANDEEKQQILTMKQLKPANVWPFCLKKKRLN